MDTVQQKPKETDITGVLVLVLVLLIGALIAKVSMDFTSQKTSSSTKAAPRKGTYDWGPWCRQKLKDLNPAIYDMASPQVSFKTGITAKCDNPSLNSLYYRGVPGLTKDQVDVVICCAPLSQIRTENNEYCTRMTRGIDAKCKLSGCGSATDSTDTSNVFTVPVTDKCDMATSTGVNANKNSCCIRPMPTSTPTPKP